MTPRYCSRFVSVTPWFVPSMSSMAFLSQFTLPNSDSIPAATTNKELINKTIKTAKKRQCLGIGFSLTWLISTCKNFVSQLGFYNILRRQVYMYLALYRHMTSEMRTCSQLVKDLHDGRVLLVVIVGVTWRFVLLVLQVLQYELSLFLQLDALRLELLNLVSDLHVGTCTCKCTSAIRCCSYYVLMSFESFMKF